MALDLAALENFTSYSCHSRHGDRCRGVLCDPTRIRSNVRVGFVSGVLYFSANHPATGTSLYRITDSNAQPERIELTPGSTGGSPRDLTNVNGTLYFVASGGGSGTELWQLAEGQSPSVIDIRTGSSSSYPDQLLDAGGQLFFVANDGTSGEELWTLDPISGAPQLLKDINPGTAYSYLRDLAFSDGKVFFTATDGSDSRKLYSFDLSVNSEPVEISLGSKGAGII